MEKPKSSGIVYCTIADLKVTLGKGLDPISDKIMQLSLNEFHQESFSQNLEIFSVHYEMPVSVRLKLKNIQHDAKKS